MVCKESILIVKTVIPKPIHMLHKELNIEIKRENVQNYSTSEIVS